MEKQIISKDDEKLNIVILYNKDLGIMAKGIARCHEEDKYNKEIGIALANTRAWIKYYEKLSKQTKIELDWSEKALKYWEDKITKCVSAKKMANAKLDKMQEEYNKMIGRI